MKVKLENLPIKYVTLALIIAAVGGGLLHLRLWRSHANQIMQLQMSIDQGAVIRAQEHRLGVELAALKAEGVSTPRKNYEERQLPGLIERLTEDLVQTHCQDRRVVMGIPQQGQAYQRIPITVQFRGDVNALIAFINRLDKYEQLVRMENAVVMAPQTAGETDLRHELELAVYIPVTEGRR